jgi:hypothetical protein
MRKAIALAAALSALGIVAAQACPGHDHTVSTDNMTPVRTAQLPVQTPAQPQQPK